MNAIFMTQTSSLGMFYDLWKALRVELSLQKVGFYVTDSFNYAQFLESHPDFEKDFVVVKEWESIAAAKKASLDTGALKKWESALNVPSLWPAVVADRRLSMGRLATLHQDYSYRYDHETLQKILIETTQRVNALFDQVKPDVVFSFICVTVGEYVSYLTAKSRGVRFMNLRPTRVKNNMTWADGIFEPSNDIKRAYENTETKISDSLKKDAEAYVSQVVNQHALYEGVIPPSRRPHQAPKRDTNFISHFWRVASRQLRYLRLQHPDDNHSPGLLTNAYYKKIVNPLTAARVNRALTNQYVTESALSGIRYAFFPLHTEPEVSLLVYSPAFVNQMDAIRLISQNLPAGMKLIVKEHPASIGKRPVSFYRKLLRIPNVLLADPALTARTLIQHSELIAIITGSVALEALILKKPVVTLGKSPFDFLPKSMIRRMQSPERLADDIHELMSQYNYQTESMVRFIACVMQLSVPLDFYSVLLNKRGVFRMKGESGQSGDLYSDEIIRLAEHTISRIQSASAPAERGLLASGA